MSELIELLERRTLEWAREEKERQDRAVEALVSILRDQLIEREDGLIPDSVDGMDSGTRPDVVDLQPHEIATMERAKPEDRLHPIRLGALINKLVEQNHGSPAATLLRLALDLGETIILIPGDWLADERTFETPYLRFENRIEMPMMDMEDGGQAIDGVALRKMYASIEMMDGHFPNVLWARTLAEGCSLRISLLSVLGHPDNLEANLEVRVNESITEGTFYLVVDPDKEDL